MKVRTMSKISRDRAIENWCWKASSERDAICNHALRILKYREWADRLSAAKVWGLMVAFNAAMFLMLILGSNEVRLEGWAVMILLFVYLDGVIGIMWASVRMSKRPLYDWAENYRELLEERREFRKEEREQDLYRRKF